MRRAGIVMPLALQRGGAERMLLHLLEANRVRPFQEYSVVFLEEGPMVDQAAQLGYPVTVIPAGRLREAGRWVRAIAELRRWLRAEEVGVVMSWMAKAHLYAGPAASAAGVPAVWWQHGIPARGWLDRLVTAIPAQGVLACSRAAMRAQASLYPRRRAWVVYPAVDLDRLAGPELQDTPAVRRRLGLREDGLLIGIVARLQRWKGVHVLLTAVADLVADFPELGVLVVGGEHPLEPEYGPWLRGFARELGLADRVRFTGYQANVAEWMAAMDIVVNASRGEPFGMAIVEAMALGKAVVGPRDGGPLEIVRDGEDGLLVPPGDSVSLAGALRRLLEDPSERARLGREARRRARAFSPARLAEATATVLRQVVDGGPAGSVGQGWLRS